MLGYILKLVFWDDMPASYRCWNTFGVIYQLAIEMLGYIFLDAKAANYMNTRIHFKVSCLWSDIPANYRNTRAHFRGDIPSS